MSLSLPEQRRLAVIERDLATDTRLVALAAALDPVQARKLARWRRFRGRHPGRVRGAIVVAVLVVLAAALCAIDVLLPAMAGGVAPLGLLAGLVLAIAGARWANCGSVPAPPPHPTPHHRRR